MHHVNRERKDRAYDDYYSYFDDDGDENGAYEDDDEASLPEEDILKGYVEFYKNSHENDNERRP